jgi:hypothetical protein
MLLGKNTSKRLPQTRRVLSNILNKMGLDDTIAGHRRMTIADLSQRMKQKGEKYLQRVMTKGKEQQKIFLSPDYNRLAVQDLFNILVGRQRAAPQPKSDKYRMLGKEIRKIFDSNPQIKRKPIPRAEAARESLLRSLHQDGHGEQSQLQPSTPSTPATATSSAKSSAKSPPAAPPKTPPAGPQRAPSWIVDMNSP